MFTRGRSILSKLYISPLQAVELIENLYNVFLKYDATLIEINPLVEDNHGKGKLGFSSLLRNLPN